MFYVTHRKTFFGEAIRKLGQTAEGVHGTGETEDSRVRGTGASVTAVTEHCSRGAWQVGGARSPGVGQAPLGSWGLMRRAMGPYRGPP